MHWPGSKAAQTSIHLALLLLNQAKNRKMLAMLYVDVIILNYEKHSNNQYMQSATHKTWSG